MKTTCDSPELFPIADALAHIKSFVKSVSDVERCDYISAVGRILSEDVVSSINVPNTNNSAMDGYAINTANLVNSKQFRIIGKSFAGQPYNGACRAGECVRIMTGGTLPEGTDAVVMQENVVEVNDIAHINVSVDAGEAVRPIGQDIKAGAVVFHANRKLSAIDIGLLASLGLSSVLVFRKLKVAVLSSGDELTAVGQPLLPGHVYDSNRPTLIALLHDLDIDVIDIGAIKDNKQALTAAFTKADKLADVVISSGGVSVGESDYTKEVLSEIGHINFWKIAMKPGKPLAFGRLSNSVFFGLPGNPVSAVVTFQKIATPILKMMSGENDSESFCIQAQASEAFRKRAGRTDFQRAYYWQDGQGHFFVKPLANQSSGVLSSITQANCYAVLQQERGNVDRGETISIEIF